jgi:hypothetical protein
MYLNIQSIRTQISKYQTLISLLIASAKTFKMHFMNVITATNAFTMTRRTKVISLIDFQFTALKANVQTVALKNHFEYKGITLT